jgi:hypothetical protein
VDTVLQRKKVKDKDEMSLSVGIPRKRQFVKRIVRRVVYVRIFFFVCMHLSLFVCPGEP